MRKNIDPCCGTGTFLIEGAMMAGHIAPGKRRHFRAENWSFIDPRAFKEAREEAKDKENIKVLKEGIIAGSDIDKKALAVARDSASLAGLGDYIDFRQRDIRELDLEKLKESYGKEEILVIANPPYGERMADEEIAREINRSLAHLTMDPDEHFTKAHSRFTVITSRDYEKDVGRKADRRRKLYNGTLPCTAYFYFRSLWTDEERAQKALERKRL